jgi:predicted small metal-binding protein
MADAQTRRQWRCLEVDCGTVVSAATDEELIEAVNAHVGEAHDSYELEEVILANAEEQPSQQTAVGDEGAR